MEINETNLYEIVYRIFQKMIDQGLVQNCLMPKRKMNLYVILAGNWEQKSLPFFQEMQNQSVYQVFTVVPKLIEESSLKKLRESGGCGTIVSQNEVNFDEASDYLTVFPVVSRDFAVKTALCISDTFETKWVQSCIGKGQKIIMLKSGLEKFTGKEPKSYVSRIKEYYKLILEYGIEIKDTVFDIKPAKAACEKIDMGLPQIKSRPKVITMSEIGDFLEDKKIILHQGDLITALAQEKALELGIETIRLS